MLSQANFLIYRQYEKNPIQLVQVKIIITVYEPDKDMWEVNFKRRKS